MSKMYLTHAEQLDQRASISDWDFGTEFAAELLADINLVSSRNAPFRIDSEDYKVYWAGTVLRVDISAEGVRRERT